MNPEEEDVNKNLINHVKGRTELSFYSLYKNIKYEETIKEYTAKYVESTYYRDRWNS